jgi:hypothetical protein
MGAGAGLIERFGNGPRRSSAPVEVADQPGVGGQITGVGVHPDSIS